MAYNDFDETSLDSMRLTAEEYICLMFDRTDLDGILYIPDWYCHNPGWECGVPGSDYGDRSYRCLMKWNICNRDRVLNQYRNLRNGIERIAPYYDSLYMTRAELETVIKDTQLLEIFDKYLQIPDRGDLDRNKIHDIADRMSTLAEVKEIASQLAKGEALDALCKSVLVDYIDITVSDEERAYYDHYVANIYKDAEKRLGAGICSYRVIYHARRLCRLLALKAPKIVTAHEERNLAISMVLHAYAISLEPVDNSIRRQIEEMERMSDEELDALYSVKRTNSRKSMAPLFVFLILQKKTDSKHPMRQQDILKALASYPYEVSIERKALSRIVHNLVDSQVSVHADKNGVWYE